MCNKARPTQKCNESKFYMQVRKWLMFKIQFFFPFTEVPIRPTSDALKKLVSYMLLSLVNKLSQIVCCK